MKKLLILLLVVGCFMLGYFSGCDLKTEYNNSIELDSGKIMLSDLGDLGGWLRFDTKSGDIANLQFSGIRELDRFYVNYLDNDGEIKDEKLRELKERMEALD